MFREMVAGQLCAPTGTSPTEAIFWHQDDLCVNDRLVPQAIKSHRSGTMDRKTDDSKIGARANSQLTNVAPGYGKSVTTGRAGGLRKAPKRGQPYKLEAQASG